MLGKARRGVRMGKQRGLYLTSGLKHSFRRGKRKKEDGAGWGSLSVTRARSPPPLPSLYLYDVVWLRAYIFRVPVEKARKHQVPSAHLYLACMLTGLLKHLRQSW